MCSADHLRMASMRLTWPVMIMRLSESRTTTGKNNSWKKYTHMDSNVVGEEAGGFVGGVAHAHHVPDILPLERLQVDVHV